MKKVVIVIPVYQEKISELELISLQQLNKVLPGYDKVFVAADGLKFAYADFCQSWPVERFARNFFQNTVTYSELLLSEEFYQRFADYEYMLIYQLDAFVFADRLMDFCNMGYDYIGAPWPMNHYYCVGNVRIGNGGLSLRKISAVCNVLRQKDKIVRDYDLDDGFLRFEDHFFAFCCGCPNIDFSVSSVSIAQNFSIDFPFGLAYFMKKKKAFQNTEYLPFGIHGWNKSGNVYYVADIINAQGYHVTESEGCNYHKLFSIFIGLYLIDRCIRENNGLLEETLQDMLKGQPVIWGYGDFGKSIYKALKHCNISVHYVLDKNPAQVFGVELPVLEPKDDILGAKGTMIIITPYKFEDSIAKELADRGLSYGRDFIKYSDIVMELERRYWNRLKLG